MFIKLTEAHLAADLRGIAEVAAAIERSKDQPRERGSYRYCELEKCLQVMRTHVGLALETIKALDFPEQETRQ